MKNLLVLYVFHIYNDRVKHFINNCIFYDENVDFVIISNDKNNVFTALEYVKKLFRDNIGYDFGGWSEALLTNDLYKNYENFIFVNSSAMGPYADTGKWTDLYLNGLRNNIKLFGSTINTCTHPLHMAHVQSYIFAMNNETLQYLIECEIFSITRFANNFDEAINHKEILMSRKIIEKGWNIGSFQAHYKDIDFTFSDKSPADCKIDFLGDIMFEKFRGTLWTEHELVFIKGNRVPI